MRRGYGFAAAPAVVGSPYRKFQGGGQHGDDRAGHRLPRPWRARKPSRFGGYKVSGVSRETHKMMLDHYSQTKCMLVSYDPKPLGFF